MSMNTDIIITMTMRKVMIITENTIIMRSTITTTNAAAAMIIMRNTITTMNAATATIIMRNIITTMNAAAVTIIITATITRTKSSQAGAGRP